MNPIKALILTLTCLSTLSTQAELVIYSDRPEARLSGALQQFTDETGDTIRFVEGNYGDLIAKLKSEGQASEADVIITKDLVYLADLKTQKMLKPFQNSNSIQTVPSFMRGTDNEWVAISVRARTAVYNPSQVSPDELTTYADLADPKWQGTLCLRSSTSAYNEALFAGLIMKHSEEGAKSIAEGWVRNLSQAPLPNDTAVLEAIAQGSCLVGVVNHYYFAGIKSQNPNFPVELAFLNQKENGVHMNGTALALLKTADNTELAQKFLEILLQEKHQLSISGAHFDFPAVEGLQPDTFIKNWGVFSKDPTPWDLIGEKISAARQIMSEAGYL